MERGSNVIYQATGSYIGDSKRVPRNDRES